MNKELKKILLYLDGEERTAKAEEEVRRFLSESQDLRDFSEKTDLIRRVISSESDALEPELDFEEFYGGVRRKIVNEQSETGFLRKLLDFLRGEFLLPVPRAAIAAAVAVILVFATSFFTVRSFMKEDNECYVDSYDFQSGVVIIDSRPDDPEIPTVIWFLDEDENV